MRFLGVALVSSAIVVGACRGGEKQAEQAAPGAQTTPSATPAPAPAAAPAAGTPAPITGKTVEIKMVGDDKGYRYEPANVTIKSGDGIKFVTVSGVPHNVAFDPAKLPADVRAQLDANFGADRMAELSSNLKMNPGDTIVLSFGNVTPGTYEFYCTPLIAMNMKGTVTVQP